MSHDTAITVTREIDASTSEIWEVLTNPARHADLDGSGFVVSDDKTDRITGTGDVFRMNMHHEDLGGDYKTENTVTGFDEHHFLSWATAPEGQEPPGWEWVWELDAQGSDATEVRLTYDWGKVTDKEFLKRVTFPFVSQHALEQSLENLAAAVSGSSVRPAP